MTSVTIGDVCSRIRNLIKAAKQDAFLTDRFIYSLATKHGAWLLKREDGANKILRYTSVMQSLDIVDLIDVDLIEADCIGLETGIKIKRTEHRLPKMWQGYIGPLIQAVTSLEEQTEIKKLTSASSYVKMARSKNFRFNKEHYYWFKDGYLYFPDIKWEGVKITGMFQEDISGYKCPDCEKDTSCRDRQEEPFAIPEYLFGELETQVLKELGMMMQIPSDPLSDNISQQK